MTMVVAGAGVAGPVTAMALRQAGFDVTLHEAHDTSAAGVGAFLTLASNGVDALRAVRADHVLDAGFRTPWISLRNARGKRLGQTRTGLVLPDGSTSVTIRRADLHQALLDEAGRRGIPISFGHRLADVERSPDTVTAVFADGTSADAELLVGADGVHSTVRRLIDAEAPEPAYAGLLSTGGYCGGVDIDVAPGCYEMIFGTRAFFGYVATPGGEVWWFANLPERRSPHRDRVDTGEELRRRLRAAFADDAGPAARLIAATEDLLPMSPVHTIASLPHWHRDRLVLVGDAIHAPSPTSGQGASLAIEDAVVLAKALRDLPDTEHALTAYVDQRRPRVERIVRTAQRINSNKAAGPIAAALRDLVLPLVLRISADGRAMNRQFDHHLDWSTLTPGSEP